jgi:Tol biopolymer transport system component
MVPTALDRLVRTCLAKDPDERWQTAHDVLLELKGIREAGAQPGMATALRPRPRERLAWSLATFAVLIAAIATTVALSLRERGSPRVLRFSVLLPKEVGSVLESAISPDGRRLAFTARHPDGKRLLWIRPIDSLAAQRLAGTEGAMLPFWSPDSRLLAFFAEDKLKKIEASGGSVQTVCEAVLGRGGTWSREGTIVFGGRSAGGDEVLHRVSEAGGAATALTQLDRAHHESIHLFPSFLPDGDHFVYFVDSDRLEDHAVKMGSLRSGKTTRLLDVISNAAYAPPGYLLYSREGTLLAQRLDTRSMQLVGEAFPLGAAVAVGGGVRRDFSVSAEGTLAYTIGTPERRLIWVDRSGRPVGTAGEPGYYVHVELSPDDARAALERLDSPGGISDVWVFDFSRGTSSRFTFDPGFDFNPVWSPDGGRIAFASNRAGAYHLYQRASAGGPEERLLESSAVLYATQWSPDGRFIVYEAFDPKTRGDLWVLPVTGDRKPMVFAATEFSEVQGQLSPDGRWMAYRSNESGREEIYVQPFPPTGGKWQVSNGGGQPRWRRDGRELYYVAPDSSLMAVSIAAGPTFQAGVPKALFESRVEATGIKYPYAIARDGQRFLLLIEEPKSPAITVVINWTALLKQ